MLAKVKKGRVFDGTKALVMGIGLHGGGVATAKWLAKQGAHVTATDKHTKEALAPSLNALKGLLITYVLGRHRIKDFRDNDLIIVNPGVPRESKYLAVAKTGGKRIENDASLFFRYSQNPVIAVTGTRGKTTTTEWVAALLSKKYKGVRASGNTPQNAFLKEFERVKGKTIPTVAEMSSWQLEYLSSSGRAPHIAVITNLYRDHLNRYRGMRDYANAKSNIFKLQNPSDFLVLNYDNIWTSHFLKKNPKASLLFISKKPLPRNLSGMFVRKGMLVFRFDGKEKQLFLVEKFITRHGLHNLENLMNTILATKLFDPTIHVSMRDALNLPLPTMRQEEIYKKRGITIINDSCATSPEGTIAAIERFKKFSSVVLITGGTDKELEFTALAKVIKKYIPKEQLVLLEGSATTHLLAKLQKLSRRGLDKKALKNLDSCVVEALQVAKNLQKNRKDKVTILFSPGAASFEKFLHEFDRGKKFNALVARRLKKTHK